MAIDLGITHLNIEMDAKIIVDILNDNVNANILISSLVFLVQKAFRESLSQDN